MDQRIPTASGRLGIVKALWISSKQSAKDMTGATKIMRRLYITTVGTALIGSVQQIMKMSCIAAHADKLLADVGVDIDPYVALGIENDEVVTHGVCNECACECEKTLGHDAFDQPQGTA